MRALNTASPQRDAPPPASVLDAFGIAAGTLAPAPGGHINRSWFAATHRGEHIVLQQLNPIFDPRVNLDIEGVTAHIARAGLATPRLVRTAAGEPWLAHAGLCWRALTRVAGVTRASPADARQTRSAGRLLGRFHAALADLDIELAAARLGVHDTQRHIAALERALAAHSDHRRHADIAPQARAVLDAAGRLPALPPMPDRLVHGDPKISNIVFDAGGRATAMIDLDTLARMPVALELGDALRSWCNRGAEDAAATGFDTARYSAALEGYAAGAGALLTPAEWRAIPAATLTIAVELAARFCADALEEAYFAWDADRFPDAAAHNLARTRAQLALAAGIASELPALERRAAEVFGAA